MDCISKKRCYDTPEQAEDALLGSHIRYNHSKNSGPINYYKCEHCGCYHLTSQGETNSALTSKNNKSKIKLAQEASYWEDKFRR
ncbi:hypothetical protein [Fulvivirga sediminis]|uniref:Uncharacterized protein n=1 Tax=Fulvivirga sediminis TaxID=2803949 RepID=A0A937K2G3_9BACT|nr:hypothetical protein [Fulvivirga sediminis]MBL3658345.1 hypothetical protein [Fulvivirga sediminis]